MNADVAIFIEKISFILTLSKVSIQTEMGASSNTPQKRELLLNRKSNI